MPRVTRRAKRRNDYTGQERQVLLTGVPLHPDSTRFGHPLFGWNRGEIESAWDQLGDELAAEWESDTYAHHRKSHSRPFAERFLNGWQRELVLL